MPGEVIGDIKDELQKPVEGAVIDMRAPMAIDLIETMAFDPKQGVLRFDRHLARMNKSAKALGFRFNRHSVRNQLQALLFQVNHFAKIRLILAQNGGVVINVQPLPLLASFGSLMKSTLSTPPASSIPSDSPDEVLLCRPVVRMLQSDDWRLRHKQSDRSIYESPGVPPPYHPLFLDDEGFLCEAAFANIFVRRGKVWLTPPLSRGLLPGILREEFIARHGAIEKDLRLEDVAEGFYLGNSLRGLLAAKMAPAKSPA